MASRSHFLALLPRQGLNRAGVDLEYAARRFFDGH
jgi:hypothetical protein